MVQNHGQFKPVYSTLCKTMLLAFYSVTLNKARSLPILLQVLGRALAAWVFKLKSAVTIFIICLRFTPDCLFCLTNTGITERNNSFGIHLQTYWTIGMIRQWNLQLSDIQVIEQVSFLPITWYELTSHLTDWPHFTVVCYTNGCSTSHNVWISTTWIST